MWQRCFSSALLGVKTQTYMPGQGENGRSCSFHHDAAQTSGPRGNLPARRNWGLARGCEKSVVEMLQDVHQQLLDKDEEIEELKAT